MTTNILFKKWQKICKKGVDKLLKVCYNKYVIKRGNKVLCVFIKNKTLLQKFIKPLLIKNKKRGN